MLQTQDPVHTAIRALSSLTRRDADAVRATVRAAACSYAVQEHDDYDGYLSVLLTPALDDLRPAYLVTGRTGAVDVAELHGDDMAAIGRFPSVGAAMAILRPLLERNQPGGCAPSTVAAAARLQERHGDDAGLHAAIQADAAPDRAGWPAVLRRLDGVAAR